PHDLHTLALHGALPISRLLRLAQGRDLQPAPPAGPLVAVARREQEVRAREERRERRKGSLSRGRVRSPPAVSRGSARVHRALLQDRKSTRLNSSHVKIS